jgi:hypothetical protein
LRTALASLSRWELDEELRQWHARGETSVAIPTVEMVLAALTREQSLLYSRLRIFLDPALRMLAETQVKLEETSLSWHGVLACAKATREITRRMVQRTEETASEAVRGVQEGVEAAVRDW